MSVLEDDEITFVNVYSQSSMCRYKGLSDSEGYEFDQLVMEVTTRMKVIEMVSFQISSYHTR